MTDYSNAPEPPDEPPDDEYQRDWTPYDQPKVITGGALSWDPVDLNPIIEGRQVTPRPTMLRRNDDVALLYPGRIHAFVGESESCKSWGAAVAIVQEITDEHHVLYVDFEDTPESFVERLRALGATGELIRTFVTYVAPDAAFTPDAEVILAESFADKDSPSLVVIDGVTEAMAQANLDPNSGPDVAAFYASYPRLWSRSGSAVLLIDHVTKSTEGRGRWAIGSERKLSGLDGAAYTFDAISQFGRGRTAKIKITVGKDRCGYVRQHEGSGKVIAIMELKSWEDDGVTVALEPPLEASSDGIFRPTIVMERISAVIEATPGLSKRAVRASVGGRNDVKDLALELLVNDGFVAAQNGPKNSRIFTSMRPFQAPTQGAEDASF